MFTERHTFQALALRDPYPFSFHFFLAQIPHSNQAGEDYRNQVALSTFNASATVGLGSLQLLATVLMPKATQHWAD